MGRCVCEVQKETLMTYFKSLSSNVAGETENLEMLDEHSR
jgi:hypothetical protein